MIGMRDIIRKWGYSLTVLCHQNKIARVPGFKRALLGLIPGIWGHLVGNQARSYLGKSNFKFNN